MLNSSTDTSKLVPFVEFLPVNIFPLAFWFTNMWEIKPTKPAESRISESENYECKRLTNIFAKTLLYYSSDYARSNPLIIKVYAIYWMRRIVIAQNPNYLGTTCCMFINCNIINVNNKPISIKLCYYQMGKGYSRAMIIDRLLHILLLWIG